MRIMNVSFWCLSSSLAEQFAKGRVILCGDSAHSLPPSGGFGMNMGISDAHNLAHKLNYFNLATRGDVESNKELLDELIQIYSAEREEGTSLFLDLSNNNLEKNLKVAKGLGLSYNNLSLLDKAVSIVPLFDQFSLLSAVKKVGSLYLDLIPTNAFRIKRENQLDLNFFNTEVNQNYQKAPLLKIYSEIGSAIGLKPDTRCYKTLLHHALLPTCHNNNPASVFSRDLWQFLVRNTNKALPFILITKNIEDYELEELSGLAFQIKMDIHKNDHGLLCVEDDRLEIDMRLLVRHYELADSEKYLMIIRSDGFVECLLKNN